MPSLPNVTPSRALLALQAIARVIVTELDAYADANVALPRCRAEELGDALLAVTGEAQRHWSELPDDTRAIIEAARRHMLRRLAALPFAELPTSASRPAPTGNVHRMLVATRTPASTSAARGNR